MYCILVLWRKFIVVCTTTKSSNLPCSTKIYEFCNFILLQNITKIILSCENRILSFNFIGISNDTSRVILLFRCFHYCLPDEFLQNPTRCYRNQIKCNKIRPNDMKSDQFFQNLIRCCKIRPNSILS